MHAPVSLKAFILVTIWRECFLTIVTSLDNKHFVAQTLRETTYNDFNKF